MAALPETQDALTRTVLLVRRDLFPTLSDETIANKLATTPVRLTASPDALDTTNGQSALVTAAILSAELGVQLNLDFPETRLLGPQPPLCGEGIRESLLDLSKDLITPARLGRDGVFEIAVGTGVSGAGVSFAADDWGFHLVTSGAAGGFGGTLPFGALLGSVAAAAELFRHVTVQMSEHANTAPLGEHPVRGPLPASYRLARFNWRATDLGAVDSISAGAIATAALYVLLRIPGLKMRLRLIDPDTGAPSNLNRYLLLHRSLLGMPKTKALATYQTDRIEIESEVSRFDTEHQAAIEPLARRVIVGVDDIPSRWRAQAAAPYWLGVGATSHFEVVVSEHTPDSPCAGCLHPRDDPGVQEEIPTISFVSAMSGFLLSYRLLRASFGEANPAQTLAYPFNVAGERPVWDGPLSARPDCPVRCTASRAQAESR
jgi:hypothetical protein